MHEAERLPSGVLSITCEASQHGQLGHLSHDASVSASCYNKQPGTAVIEGTIEPQGDVFARRSMARRQYNVSLMTLG